MNRLSQNLTIVMYHFVRDVAGTPFDRLPVRTIAEIDRQFDAIASTCNVVGLDQMHAALHGEDILPENPVLLTFDDGYREHYEVVFPRLRTRDWSAVFFPATSVLESPVVLNVNKIQFLRTCIAPEEIYSALLTWLDENREAHSLDQTETYLARWAIANRFDDPHAMFVKNMLQRGLPSIARQQLTDELFAQSVTKDEADFSHALYMNRDEIAEMAHNGMSIGVHGHSHDWMTDLSPDRLQYELKHSLSIMENCGVPTEKWCLCYPFGGVNTAVRATAAALGATSAVTTEPRVANLRNDDALLLPRLDTNDLPH